MIKMPPVLVDFIQQKIHEMKPDQLRSWPQYAFKHRYNALPLHFKADYLWAITPDGKVLCRDLLAFDRVEIETDPDQIREVLENGAQVYPALQMLLD